MNTVKYYDGHYEKIFHAVENPQWRVWKTVDQDGIVRQNKTQITNPKRLLRFIKQCTNPQALYVSVSTFLNPHKNHGFFWNQKKTTGARYFYPRDGYTYADNILLDSYFFVDFDSEEDLRIAQKDARKVIQALTKIGYRLHSVQFSGSKGVHTVFERLNESQYSNPALRILHYQEQNKMLEGVLKKLDLVTMDRNHWNIIKDVFRVYAAPYSIKSNGNIVQPLPVYNFMHKDIYSLLQSPTTGVKASEAKANESKVATAKDDALATQIYQGRERAGLSSGPIFFKFIDNMVRGLKNTYVTVIKKKKHLFKASMLQRLQETYKLSDFLVYEVGNDMYAINFKLVQYERLIKIMRAARSENLSRFTRTQHVYIPISDVKSDENKTVHELNYVGTLLSQFDLHAAHSRPHSELFGFNFYGNIAGTSFDGQCKMGVAT